MILSVHHSAAHPMKLNLPEFFKAKLDTDVVLTSCVLETITDFSAWMSDSNLPFFEDYTDHGVSHLEGVLETMQGLIPGVAKIIVQSSGLRGFDYRCGCWAVGAGDIAT